MLEDPRALKAARERVADQALADINVTDPELWSTDTVWAAFERLRREDPVHLHPPHQHRAGAFWSVTRYDDIVAVDTNHQDFSSEPSIFLSDQMEDFELPAFIQMDSPRHDVQRKTVSPIVSPHSLTRMEPLIRSRIQKTLDGLPIGEPFDWVDRVSVELTGQMLATLFDFPFEDRRKLTYWSDVAMAEREATDLDEADFDAHFKAVMLECAEYFTRLWQERAAAPPKDDLISMLAHGAATREMSPMEYLGNLILLIVGGNDTTRNTMSGSVLAMHLNPDQRAKLDADHALIPSMVSETIRWQTPLAYMRRTAKREIELCGKAISAGDKVVMWYASGNRDETAITDPDRYLIDRPNARRHLSFGFGIHRCVGNRLAELQLRILWEEILARFPAIEVTALERVPSPFIRGYTKLETIIPRRL